MQKKKYIIVGIVLLILTGIFLVSSSGSDPVQIVLERTDFIETISAAGRVEAANRITMIYQKSGTIESIFANEGERMEEGTMILALQKDEEQNFLRNSQIQLSMAENEFANISQRERSARTTYEAARKNRENLELALERNQALFDLGAVSKNEIEINEYNFKQAVSTEVMAETEYQGLRPGGTAWEGARLSVETARNNLERAEIDKNKKIIYAPFDGILLEVNDQPFSNVTAGQPALIFAEERSFIIADIDERDYQKVEAGQKVMIQLINREQIIEGTVRDVSPKIDRTRGTVRVRIDLSEDLRLTPDTGVNVEIIINEYTDEFLIPEAYVSKNPERIVVNQNNRAKVIVLETFTRTGDFYLVSSPDLSSFEGLKIVSGTFEDGDRVK